MVITTQVPTVHCWLCGKPVEVKFSTKEKPYLICDARKGGCGMQIFLREDRAIHLLQDKIREEMKHE